jgi:hypothetical protein
MIESLKYSLKIWLTTILIAPIGVIALQGLVAPTPSVSEYLSDAFGTYYLLVIFGLLFSFLTWVAFLVAVYQILKRDAFAARRKLFIQYSGFLLSLVTFAGFFAVFTSLSAALFDSFFISMILCYTACQIASIYFIRMPELEY